MQKSLSSHLTLAHRLWDDILGCRDLAIDATCGNGHDTLKLATLLPQGTVIAIDIQSQAIENTRSLLKDHLERVLFYQQSHASFPAAILPESAALIVYNLGYLPGSDKTIKTKDVTTLTSLKAAFPLLKPRGIISMTCYPGHPEGKEERDLVLNFLINLDPKTWGISRHLWLQGIDKPELLIIQKIS